MKNSNILGGLLMCILTGVLIATILGVGPVVPILVCLGLSLAMGYANRNNKMSSGVLRAGLLKEIWLSELADKFFDDDEFLTDGKDWSPWIENDVINLAEIGASPTVMKNNTTFPITAATRTDVPIALPVDNYSTTSTIVRKLEQISLAYDKRQSVLSDHKKSLQQKIGDDGIFNIAPTANTTDTPVIKTSGALSAVSGYKIMTADDIMRLAIAYDNRKFSKKGRTIVVPPTQFWEFVNTDSVLKEQAKQNGKGGEGTDVWVYYMGFKIRSRVTTAYYNKTTLAKIAYGAVPGSSDRPAAISYIAQESFGKGLGTNEMFATIGDPAQQGDIVNFLQKAIVLPVRQKTIGAIVASES